MTQTHQTVAIVGLGRMGANMARRIHDCTENGYVVTAVHDIDYSLSQSLAKELNCTATSTLAETTAAADVILTVVTDDQAMLSLFVDSGDSLLSQAQDKTFINCATVSPEVHITIESACKKVGASSLEACMASSISQARDGSLYLMIGGQAETFESCQPLLDLLSSNLRYIGPAGQAAKVKALVNMVMNINTAALAEGLGLGEALGIDPQLLCEVFAQTGANSRVLETDAEDMIDRDHECWFSAAHAAKDSGIANAMAKEEGLTLPLSQTTQQQYQRMIDSGLGELDKSGIAELTFKGRKT